MKLNDKVYNVLKWLALIFFDAIGIFYKTIATIWNLPFGIRFLRLVPQSLYSSVH